MSKRNERTISLRHWPTGSTLFDAYVTGTDNYVNIPGFTFHEPLEAYLANDWMIIAEVPDWYEAADC